MADDDWRAPVLGEDGAVQQEEAPPLSITGLLREAAEPKPFTGTALSLVLDDHALADAGIPVTVKDGTGLENPVKAFVEPKNPNIPASPPGVSVDDNMHRARQMQEPDIDRASADMVPSDPAYGVMTGWFSPGHEMDYKKGGQQYRDFGNFNYGAVGSSLGITPYVLHGAAGLVQVMQGHWNPDYGIPFISGHYGDNVRDYEQIKSGIGYAQSHKPK